MGGSGEGPKSLILQAAARISVRTGIGVRDLFELEADEFEALSDALVEWDQQQSWAAAEELLASQTELLFAVLTELRVGVPTIAVKKQGRRPDMYEHPRPDWVKKLQEATGKLNKTDSDEIVIRPRDLRQKIKGG